MDQSALQWLERRPAPPPRRPSLWQVLSLPLLFFLSLPLLALFLRLPAGSLLENISRPQVLQAIFISLSTAFAATLVTILLGTPLAYAMAQRRLPFQRVIDTLIDLPIVLPPAVAGVALLMAFGRRGILGGLLEGLNLQIAFTTLAVILAQVFIASPFYIKSALLGFSSVDAELEQAASLDGASTWEVFFLVKVPLAWPALVGGSVMTWARALGEFGATIIFAGNFPGRTQTMPLAIYIGFELDLSVALTLSAILVSLSFLALMLVKGFLRRQIS